MRRDQFDPVFGQFQWPVDQDGYEIVAPEKAANAVRLSNAAAFYRDELQEADLLGRGVIRRKGGPDRWYRPMVDTPGMARQLASLHREDDHKSPRNGDIRRFVARFGLLANPDGEYVADWIYTIRYLAAFARAIDRGDKALAREIFNERIVPPMTVRLRGSKDGRPTANWSLAIAPTNLMGAAWLQIAGELTSGIGMQKCAAPDCLDWFPERSNKRFCNDRCRNAAHRHLKAGVPA